MLREIKFHKQLYTSDNSMSHDVFGHFCYIIKMKWSVGGSEKSRFVGHEMRMQTGTWTYSHSHLGSQACTADYSVET